MDGFYEKYVWEVPVRVTHWVIVLCIILLSVTGVYIGAPKTLALQPSQYVMGWTRFVHFVAGYAFLVSFLARVYWMFVGNKYAGWREFFPLLSDEQQRNMTETFKYYVFISNKVPTPVGHNALAGAAYFGVFCLYLVMILTGFALYSQHAPHSFWHFMSGWLFFFFSSQGIRLTHHMVMWFLIAFSIHHIYSAWLMDVKERAGIISSICSGYKTVRARHLKHLNRG
jgi:Ni/Fe-hydrogenase 1 B-type cytochrome subunit